MVARRGSGAFVNNARVTASADTVQSPHVAGPTALAIGGVSLGAPTWGPSAAPSNARHNDSSSRSEAACDSAGVTVYVSTSGKGNASAEIGERVLGTSLFSAEAVARRKSEIKLLLRAGILPPNAP